MREPRHLDRLAVALDEASKVEKQIAREEQAKDQAEALRLAEALDRAARPQ